MNSYNSFFEHKSVFLNNALLLSLPLKIEYTFT